MTARAAALHARAKSVSRAASSGANGLVSALATGRRGELAICRSLSFIVAATQIGLELGLITKATSAALIAAGVLSVLIFPIIALTLLRR